MQTMSIELAATLITFALLLGAAVTYFWARSRIEIAAQQAAVDKTAELMAAEERMRFAMQESARQLAELERLSAEHRSLETALTDAQIARAQFEERAERVGPLEQTLGRLQEEERRLNEKLIQLSNADGQKTREIADLTERIVQHTAALAECNRLRDQAVAAARAQGEALAEVRTALEGEKRRAADRERAQQADCDRLNDELASALAELRTLRAEGADNRQRLGELATDNVSLRDALEDARARLEAATRQADAAAAESRSLGEALAELRTTLEAERSQAQEKLALLNEAKEQLTAQFENLANRILEEKSERFSKQNQESIGALLTPLQSKIKEFQDQVAQTYDRDSKERLTLKNEIERLAMLNTKISEDAVNLTHALKGNNKTQGVWGEMVLERVLETSGLEKGREYSVQESFATDTGSNQRPDVVIYLPEGKHMVIDSKMSLVAYERYCSADTEAERTAALREHLASMRTHIKGLSEKGYQSLHGLKTLDFVLMFVPVEPAFMLAATNDDKLFSDAFARNVLLVSPSTLLATLRTIANIWRQEYQNRNAQAIADQCAKLYDKFVGFVDDLEEVGDRLEKAQKSYQAAHGKLTSGRGNLVGQLDKVRKLGVKPSKHLPAAMLEDDGANEALELAS